MTQEARKAIIELLFLSLYMDDHLSLAEDGVLTEALDSLGWDSEEPREEFIYAAFASAREANDDPSKMQAFFLSRADTIRNEKCEAEGMTWLSRVLSSDGLTSTEKYVLTRLEKYFYP